MCLNTNKILCIILCAVLLLQYSVSVKQNTISRMERLAAREERRAKLAETKLDEDAIAFDEFLKENDRNSVEALKMLVMSLQFPLLIIGYLLLVTL